MRLLDTLHKAQNSFYGGGGHEALRGLLSQDITWTVPGHNRIAGVYRGIDEVLAYFTRRRDIAAATFRMHRVDVLTGTTNKIAALTNGTAIIAGTERNWSTVGLYSIRDEQIEACSLLPLDPAAFDEIWSI